MTTATETIELMDGGFQFEMADGWFRVFGDSCRRLTSGPQCEAGCEHVSHAMDILAQRRTATARLDIACPDCRARQIYEDTLQAWEDGDQTEPEPIPPKLRPMRFVCHDEYQCEKCKGIFLIPDC